MSRSYSFHADVPMAVAGLVQRAAVPLPAIITATGREAPHQVITIPSSISIGMTLLPHLDYEDDPAHRPGAGFVGSRLSALPPSLPPAAVPHYLMVARSLVGIPKGSAEILRSLRTTSGLHWAPGALFQLAGWTDAALAEWLEHLRLGDETALLIVAERQASSAVRRMWGAALWRGNGTGDRGMASVVATGRAVIDLIAACLALFDRLRASGKASLEIVETVRRMMDALTRFVHRVEQAAQAFGSEARDAKLKTAVEHGRRLVEAAGLLSVWPTGASEGWWLASQRLSGYRAKAETRGGDALLDQLSERLERIGPSPGSRLQNCDWPSHVRRFLLRLAGADRHARMALLERLRTDLIFSLAMTKRLDRLYLSFPWLISPHAAFPGCFGGPLGALASLLECGRAMEIAEELTWRLTAEIALPAKDYEVERLTVRNARPIYQSNSLSFQAAVRGTLPGIALELGAISHASVTAQRKGAYFGPHHPLTEYKRGSLCWNLAESIDPCKEEGRLTFETLRAIEARQPVYAITTNDNDLPHYMGLIPARCLAASLVAIFRASTGRDIKKLSQTMREAASSRPANTLILSRERAMQEALNSMLKTLDRGVDNRLRHAVDDCRVAFDHNLGEVGRLERKRVAASTRGKILNMGKSEDLANPEQIDAGQGRLRQALADIEMTKPRSNILVHLVDGARLWTMPKNGRAHKDKGLPEPQDDLLEMILRGHANLAQCSTVSDLALPVLWFSPFIDRDRIRHQCGQGQQDIEWSATIDYVSCALFTGLSVVTGDPAHVRQGKLQGKRRDAKLKAKEKKSAAAKGVT